MRASDKKTNLVGRQVYFNLPKAKMRDISHSFTPKKLYTIIDYHIGSLCAWIVSDTGTRCYIALDFKCSHLQNETNWSLKNKSKVSS